MQILAIKKRTKEYYYLLKNYPNQIITNQGVSKWINYEWTEENEKNLLNLARVYHPRVRSW